MGGAKAGKKRKEDKNSPSSQTVESENRRLMANYISDSDNVTATGRSV